MNHPSDANNNSCHDYALLILTDATGSMGHYLQALNQALPDIIRVSALTGCFSRIGVLAYRDYCDAKITQWSGWYHVAATTASNQNATLGGSITKADLLDFVKNLNASGGGDEPEATKTGLAHSYQVMHETDGKAVILLFADAPPHTPKTGGKNHERETNALLQPLAFGGYGHLFRNWLVGAKAIAKKAEVFALIQTRDNRTMALYSLLTRKACGACFSLTSCDPQDISSAAIGILLAWMGAEKEGAEQSRNPQMIDVVSFPTCEKFDDFDEKNDVAGSVAYIVPKLNYARIRMEELQGHVHQSDSTKGMMARMNFAKWYQNDPAYQKVAVEQLADIIKSNVAAIASNPVFGNLWRAVCSDRLCDSRDGLVNAFAEQVGKIEDHETKKLMKDWLEESYNYTADILAMIESVDPQDRYPCVFLDPTETFESHGDDPVIPSFTRIDLLEIGRSCDPRVLKHLGRVLTRLTYVDSTFDLPEHLQNVPEYDIPRIPMALALPKYKRKFWKVLLHTVVPGTLMTARSAALIAALTLRMGLTPLRDAADTELLHFCTKWNSLDIPETWNVSCLSLILDADNDYETRVRKGETARPFPNACVLSVDDRKLFQTLVNYKMLEVNLATSLAAKIGWCPNKNKVAIGPLVRCAQCCFPRSVTIMGPLEICGVCLSYTTDEEEKERMANVTTADDECTPIAWVECAMTNCRAQYVVYNPDRLNARAKCHYCREHIEGGAPTVECTQCLNRVIWPTKYRPMDFHLKTYKCPGCLAGHPTIVDKETSAKQLAKENGSTWLLRNDGMTIADPFNGRSLFYTISKAGIESFANKVECLPESKLTASLTIGGKQVHNSASVISSLRTWVLSRRAERGLCTLCFKDLNKSELRLACGRSGCASKICLTCTSDWYGLNARGRIIHIAALSCPFCRRRPIPKTIQTFGLHGVGNLRLAVEEAGTWIYAWCDSCGFAKRMVERVCAAGAPADVQGWQCEECVAEKAAACGVPLLLGIKSCPGCGTATEKMGGCDHMSCAVPKCGTHWCWHCGAKVPLKEIYRHMDEEHGGWYGGGVMMEEQVDEEEEANLIEIG